MAGSYNFDETKGDISVLPSFTIGKDIIPSLALSITDAILLRIKRNEKESDWYIFN